MNTRIKSLVAASSMALAAFAFPQAALADHHGGGHEHEHAHAEASAETAASGPALWQLTDEDTTVYLFGTIHVLPEGEGWYDERIATAFDASEELIFEIDMDDMAGAAGQMQAAAMLPAGTTLRSLMTEENTAEFEAALAGLGIPAAAFDPLEPWIVSLTVGMMPLLQAGWQPNSGVEMVLRGRAEDKQRGALETVEEQLELFDGLPMEAQLQMLDETVESLDQVLPMLDALKAEWLEGDADALGELMNEGFSDPVIYDRLLVNRNRNWVEWIEARMDEPGTVFVAVGAGHLAGDGSVQSLLAERGLMVERIEN